MTTKQIGELAKLARLGMSYKKISKVLGVSAKVAREQFLAEGFTLKKRGLALLTPEARKKIARLGGKKTASTPGRMSAMGKVGGKIISSDEAHMRKIGRRGGISISKNKKHMSKIGRLGGLTKSRNSK